MALTNPQYDAIMRMYNERQLRHQREQQEHIRIAYEKIPRLAEIDAEIASLSVRKAKAMLNGDASMDLDLNVQIPETLDSRSAYSDEKVVTYATDTSYQPVMPYETVRYVEKKEWKLNDVASGRVSMEEFAAQLDAAQLADLCCGTGWGVQDENNPVIGASSESVPGAAGETTHALESYGVSSIVLADGPGGVRITQQFEATDLESGEKRQVYHYCTAWPVGTLLAQSFDPEILEQVGCGMAADMQAMRIDLLLGPGMNIQRDPMCGRNFEYFS